MKEKIKPPKYASKNAKKSLKCIAKGSKAMTKTGIKRANQLANRENLSIQDLKSINSFRRHKQNAEYKGDICKDKGAVSWLGWGYGFRKGCPSTDFGNWARRKYE
jgi:hypothetical protein